MVCVGFDKLFGLFGIGMLSCICSGQMYLAHCSWEISHALENYFVMDASTS